MRTTMRTPGRYLAILILTLAGVSALAAEFPEPDMSWLDNGEVRVGFDLALGGAVTHISGRGHPGNMINSHDLGRQIQMSHYSGPWPFEVGDIKPKPHWAGLGWNPIQTGDSSMNPSRVVEFRNDGTEMYVKCVPMQWPLDNVPGDCVFETRTTLDGALIRMRFRCVNLREDRTVYRACAQELPAVYTISTLSRLMSYTGDRPFTGGELTHVPNNWREGWPWTRFTATERWAALVNPEGFGLGVFKDDAGEFHGGVFGDDRSSDPKHGSTSYVAPIHREMFDNNIIYEHETTLMVGSLKEIRRTFNSMATKSPPRWVFERDRQHWILTEGTDEGFPLDGSWKIRFGDGEARLEGPRQCWRAEDAPKLIVRVSGEGVSADDRVAGRVFWRTLEEDAWAPGRSAELKISSDGTEQVWSAELSAAPGYGGLLTGLRIDLSADPETDARISILSIGWE